MYYNCSIDIYSVLHKFCGLLPGITRKEFMKPKLGIWKDSKKALLKNKLKK